MTQVNPIMGVPLWLPIMVCFLIGVTFGLLRWGGTRRWIGAVLGLLAIAGLMAAMLLPYYSRARMQARPVNVLNTPANPNVLAEDPLRMSPDPSSAVSPDVTHDVTGPVRLKFILIAGGGLFVVLLVRTVRGGRNKTAASMALGLVLVLGIGMFFFVGVRSSVAPRVVSTSVPSSPRPSAREIIPDRAATDRLDPDIFPSSGSAAVQCARKLVRQWLDTLDRQAARDLRRLQLRVTPDPRDEERVRTALRTEFRASPFSSPPASQPQPVDRDRPTLTITVTTVDPGNDQPREFVVQGSLTHGDFQAEFQNRAVDKPWVEQRAAREAVVADPGLLGSSPDQALLLAIDKAAEQVDPVLRRDFAGRSYLSSTESRQEILRALQGGDLIRDRFTQQFNRPYGTVWRTALLVDTSSDAVGPIVQKFNALAKAKEREACAEREALRRRIFSGVGLVALISVIYLFLNAATKGYYVWSLRVGGGLLLLAGVATVCLIA